MHSSPHLRAGLTPEQLRNLPLARAQAAWLTRQTTLDPRLARFSRTVEAQELETTITMLRSLFDRAALFEVSVGAAIDWIDVLLEAQEECGSHAPSLPLPLLWIPKRVLDALDAEEQEGPATLAESLAAMQARRATSRAKRTKLAKPAQERQGAITAGEGEATQSRPKGGRRGRGGRPMARA